MTIVIMLLIACIFLLVVPDIYEWLTHVKQREKIAVYLCSPYRGPDMLLNIDFARRICREIQLAGAVVFAPHLHTTQFLNDEIEEERNLGINSGLEIMARFDEAWFVLPAWRDELSTGMGHEHKAAHYLKRFCVMARTEADFKQQLEFLKKRVSDRRATVQP